MNNSYRRGGMKGVTYGALTALCAVSLVATAALAEENKENSTVFSLGKIEVTGKSDKDSSPAVTTVSGEDMLTFDRKTVAEAANLLPGVTISKVGPRNESMIYVRGFDLRRTPLFLDGIPIYIPYDGYPDLGRFMTYDLSELDLSKGSASVLYGPNTMGGAINMVSKRPAKLFEGNAGAGYTSGDAYHAFANLGTNQKSWYLQGGGSWVDLHSFQLSDDFKPTSAENGGRRENSYQRDGKGTIKLGLTPNISDEYALSYIYQHGEKGTPPYAGTNPSTSLRYWRWPYWDKQSVYLNTHTTITDKGYVKSRIYYDIFRNSLNQFTNAAYSVQGAGNSAPSWYDDYSLGGSLEAGTTLIPYNSLKLAFHFKDDVHRETTAVIPKLRSEDRIYSVSVEDSIELTKKLSVVIGISYDTLTAVKAEKYNSTTKQIFDLATGDKDSVNPQASLVYAYSDSGKLHASIGAKSRFASIKERTTWSVDLTNVENPYLKPERTVNYELGVQDTLAGLVKVKSGFFVNAISDYIQSNIIGKNSSNKNKTQNQNIGRINRYGYEFEAFAPLSEMVETGCNYTFIYNDNLSNSMKLTDVPKHKLFVYGKLTPLKPLSILASAEYDSRRYSNSDGSSVAGEFLVVTSKVSYEAMRDLTFEAGVNNLLDRNYALTEGYPEAGRNYFFQARYRF